MIGNALPFLPSPLWGYLVIRFWNSDVLANISGALEVILNTLTQHAFEPPHPDPLPDGEREKSA